MTHRSNNKRKPKPIPIFNNIDEEAEFWDTHSTEEYGEWEEVEDFQIDVIRGATFLSFRMDEELLARIDSKAAELGIHADELIVGWLKEHLALKP